MFHLFSFYTKCIKTNNWLPVLSQDKKLSFRLLKQAVSVGGLLIILRTILSSKLSKCHERYVFDLARVCCNYSGKKPGISNEDRQAIPI